MKKYVKIILSLLLIVLLFPKTNTAAIEPQGLDTCNINDSLYNGNFSVYDLYDDSNSARSFSYSIPDGGAAVLIFFQTGCWNCRSLLSALSQSDLITNDKVKFTAIEINDATRSETSSFISEVLGGRKENVNVYYGGSCNSLLWSYVRLVLGQIYELSTPLVLISGSVNGAPVILNHSEGYLDTDDLRLSLSLITDSVKSDITHVDGNIDIPDSEYTVREGDNTSYHGSEDVIIGLEGTFATVDEAAKQTILSKINEIRKEACDNGYPHPGDRTKKLTPADYVPIKWSEIIEKIAAMRAAEASVCIGHQRLSAKESNVFFNGYDYSPWSSGEILAWNWGYADTDGIIQGINQFYDEKDDWLNNTPGAVTGHYTSMISPGNTYIGVAGFFSEYAQFRLTVAAQLSSDSSLSEKTAGVGGKVYQKVKVDKTLVTDLSIKCKKNTLAPNETVSAVAEADITKNYGYQSSGHGPVFSGVSWKSSDPSVASVDGNGVIKGIKEGNATITAYIDDLVSATFDIRIKIKENHNIIHHEAKEATHFEAGNTEYWECTDCGAVFSDPDGNFEITIDDTYIPVAAHNFIMQYYEYGHRRICIDCGYSEEFTEHVFDGNVCTICGYTKDPSPIDEHNLIFHEAKNATHFDAGNKEYWECVDCGKLFFAENDSFYEVTEEDILIPVIPHVFYKTESNAAGHRQICGCGYATEFTGHTYDDNNVCTVCGYRRSIVDLPGDVNGDNRVDNKDVVVLFRYTSSAEYGGSVSDAYDFNADGEINNKDVVALFRYVSNIDTSENPDDTTAENTDTDTDPDDEQSVMGYHLDCIDFIGRAPDAVRSEEFELLLQSSENRRTENSIVINEGEDIYILGWAIFGSGLDRIECTVNGSPIICEDNYRARDELMDAYGLYGIISSDAFARAGFGTNEHFLRIYTGDLTSGEYSLSIIGVGADGTRHDLCDTAGYDHYSTWTLIVNKAETESGDLFPSLPNPDPDFAGNYAWANMGSEEYVRVDNVYLHAGSYYTNSGIGTGTVSGASYDKDTNTLTLENYRGGSIDVNLMGNGFKIRLIGENHVSGITVWGSGYGGSVTFTGNGSLVINEDLNYNIGLMIYGDMSMSCVMIDKDATVEVFGESAIVIHCTQLDKAIYTLSPIEITGGVRSEGEFFYYIGYKTDEDGFYVLDENGDYITEIYTVKDIGASTGMELYDYSVVDENGDPSNHVIFKPAK